MAAILLCIFTLLSGVLETTKSCPSVCRCHSEMFRTNCREKNLTRVPKGIPKYTQILVLSFNPISRIDLADFRDLPNLKTLRLQNTSLHSIDTSIFRFMRNLTALDLRDNEIRSIRFYPLPSLLMVDLSGNLITVIHKDSFTELESLKELILQNNKIYFLHQNSFRKLQNLTRLNLKENHLRSLKSGTFTNLARLEVLDLSSNFLDSLHSNLFAELINLRHLLLSNNKLTALPSNLFLGLANLRMIELSHNRLTFINRMAFPDLRHLAFIYIYGNLIPCGCQFIELLGMHPYQANVLEKTFFADCHISNETSQVFQPSSFHFGLSDNWSIWCERNISSFRHSRTAYVKIRACRDCLNTTSRLCTYNGKKDSGKCIFVEGVRWYTTRSRRVPKCDIISRCTKKITVTSDLPGYSLQNLR